MPVDSANKPPVYRGRFAPSPTGPLHFGSLVAATASYLQAKISNGTWLVRIEDIDPQREIPGASDAILRSLDAHGFEFAEPLYQSSRLDLYDSIVEQLVRQRAAYRCSCTRQIIRATARVGRAGTIYPGTCRTGADESQRKAVSVRVRTTDSSTSYVDLLQGRQICQLESEIGDFLIRRGDGKVAYQLAVVVDDHEQQISEVVRGTDLLNSTFMQLWLQRILHYDTPQYLHFPVVLNKTGEKLAKQTGAPEIDSQNPVKNLFQVLVFLRQEPELMLQSAPLQELWSWARENWQPDRLAGLQTLPE
jgi:glutamyl-Q tRNA(Asp) synthetase